MNSVESSCHIRVRHFPFDVQRCEMQFQSWVYPRKEVQLIMMSKNAAKDDFTGGLALKWNYFRLKTFLETVYMFHEGLVVT